MKLEYIPTDSDLRAIQIIKDEKTSWEDGTCFVTDNKSYKMLGSDGIIQKSRKNYLGLFENDIDPLTGKKKMFVPMTEDMVESIVKNIDIDSADINVRATNQNGTSSATIIEYLLKYFMRKNFFGELLNEMIRIFCIDGTVVLKTYRNIDRKLKKQVIKSKIVDSTNFLIDPTEENIQDAGAVIERNVLKLSEAQKYPWDNLDYLEGSNNIGKLGILDGINTQGKTQVPYVEIFERWGELPLYCITGKDKDADTWVDTVAIISNIDNNPIVHKIALNKSGIKPYEECRFRKIFGRWHGRGVGEILMKLQAYLNETINLRLNKARVSQIGLFKYRKGSGITQQLISSLISGGAIPVTRMDDIQELAISDIKASSYQDEQNIYNWGQRATGSWDVGRGEALPVSQPATTAVLQERGMRSGFDLIQEGLGIFLSRLFERHIIPLIIEIVKDKEVISIIGSAKELKEIDENVINNKINEIIVNSLASGKGIPPIGFLEKVKEMMKQGLAVFKKTRYISITKSALEKWEYQVEVIITNEAFNKAVIVKQLNDMLLTYSRIPGINIDIDAIFKEILDLMGIGGARFLKMKEEVAGTAPATNVPEVSQTRPLEETEMAGEAMTQERYGR
jgi:hypothetical protein